LTLTTFWAEEEKEEEEEKAKQFLSGTAYSIEVGKNYKNYTIFVSEFSCVAPIQTGRHFMV
jgi:predicted RNase H-related nuclease YkuK (DUF458 family)